MTTHLLIPDTQVKDGVNMDHLEALGNWIVEHRPQRIIHIGDHADMPSLSAYDKGKKSFEGRRYLKDVDASIEGMQRLMAPVDALLERQRSNKIKLYKPTMDFTLGNHENRINRAIENQAELDGVISVSDLMYEAFGWTVHPFLRPVILDGITYVHYVQNANAPTPVSRAHLIAARRHGSYTCGHQPGLDYYMSSNLSPEGRRVQCIIAGSFYAHDEEYRSYQGNEHWRGVIVKNNVRNGNYDPTFLSIESLLEDYL